MYYRGFLSFFFFLNPSSPTQENFPGFVDSQVDLGSLFPGARACLVTSLPIISNLIMNHPMRKVTSISHENLNHILLNWDNLVDASFRVSIFICFLLKSSVASCGCCFMLGD